MALKREDWTLLAIAAAGGGALTPVQLQKVLFLLDKQKGNLLEGTFYQFTAYNYGPFDKQVYLDAEELERSDLVAIRSAARWNEYAATPAGLHRARDLEGAASNSERDAANYLRRAVEWARSISFQQLVRAIYAAYPEMRANSVFQG